MKTTLAFALVTGSSLFAAQPTPTIQSGMPLQAGQLQPAFSQSARFETGDSWDCTLQGAFTYFHASQDNMEVALPFPEAGSSQSIPVQKFKYEPGFEVGITINSSYDRWMIGAGYLWYRSNTSTSQVAPDGSGFYPAWFSDTLSSFQSKWHLGIDQADLYASRPFYLGQKLTVSPYFGLKSNWIRQNFKMTGVRLTDGTSIDSNSSTSHAWGIGPEAGLQANFLLGCGFGFFGNAGTSLLYTTYSTLISTSTILPSILPIKENNYNALRTNLDSALGIEWESYVNDGSWLFQFSAAYSFSAFFNQNMIHSISQFGTAPNVATTNAGNLYLHGVTVSASVLF